VLSFGPLIAALPKDLHLKAAKIIVYLKNAPIKLSGSNYQVTYLLPPITKGSSLLTLIQWTLDEQKDQPFDGQKFLLLLQRMKYPTWSLSEDKIEALMQTPEGVEKPSPQVSDDEDDEEPVKKHAKIDWEHLF